MQLKSQLPLLYHEEKRRRGWHGLPRGSGCWRDVISGPKQLLAKRRSGTVARADELRKSGVVGTVAPAEPAALCFSRIAPGGALRKEEITRIREQLRQGTYHIRAAEVAKAILRSEPSLESVKRRSPRPVLMSITVPACSVRRH